MSGRATAIIGAQGIRKNLPGGCEERDQLSLDRPSARVRHPNNEGIMKIPSDCIRLAVSGKHLDGAGFSLSGQHEFIGTTGGDGEKNPNLQELPAG
jgi:hypothetical protein